MGIHPGLYRGRIPIWVKLLFTVMCLLILIFNAIQYTLIDLLWFCDVAILLTIFCLWFESSLLFSMVALSSIAPQFAWQIDYFFQLLSGYSLFGFTDYMFEDDYPFLNKMVSWFHVWMPYLILYALRILGYHPKALFYQIITGCSVILVSYFFTNDMYSPAGNINKVYGFTDDAPQTWMHPWLWVLLVMLFTVLVIYVPSHLAFSRTFKKSL